MKRWIQSAGWVLTLAVVSLFAMVSVAWAQADPNAALSGAIGGLGEAIENKGGTFLIIAAALSLAMQLLKHPIFGGVMFKLPARLRPLIPVIVGAVAGLMQDMGSGGNWAKAIMGAVMTALPAITMHQTYKAVRPAALKPQNPSK